MDAFNSSKISWLHFPARMGATMDSLLAMSQFWILSNLNMTYTIGKVLN